MKEFLQLLALLFSNCNFVLCVYNSNLSKMLISGYQKAKLNKISEDCKTLDAKTAELVHFHCQEIVDYVTVGSIQKRIDSTVLGQLDIILIAHMAFNLDNKKSRILSITFPLSPNHSASDIGKKFDFGNSKTQDELGANIPEMLIAEAITFGAQLLPNIKVALSTAVASEIGLFYDPYIWVSREGNVDFLYAQYGIVLKGRQQKITQIKPVESTLGNAGKYTWTGLTSIWNTKENVPYPPKTATVAAVA